MTRVVLLGAFMLLAIGCNPLADTGCTSNATVQLVQVPLPPLAGRTGQFDGLDIDQQAHLLLVADRTELGVDVLDVSTSHPRYLGTAVAGSIPNGVVAAPDAKRAFAGLSDGAVAMIDTDAASPTFLRIVARVATGARGVDLVGYDPDRQLVLAASPTDGLLVLVSSAGKVTGQVRLGPGLEQPVYDAANRTVYVGSSTQDVVWAVDPASATATSYPVGTICGPAGMAINPATQRALLGCSAHAPQQLVLWDLQTHRTAATTPKAGGGDLAVYASGPNRFLFAAGHEAAGPEIAILDGAGNYLTAVGLPAAAPGVAYDETNRLVYTQDTRAGKGGLFKFAIPSC